MVGNGFKEIKKTLRERVKGSCLEEINSKKVASKGFFKAWVFTSSQNQMLLAYFNSKGGIKTDFVKGLTVNFPFIIESLRGFLNKIFTRKGQ